MIQADVKGIRELLKKAETLEMNIPQILGEAGYYAMAGLVESDATSHCPIDTGLLQSSIHTKITTQTRSLITVQTGTNIEYAPYVEFGTGRYAINGNGRQTPWIYEYKGKKGPKGNRWTVGQKPQPFLNPALLKNKNKIPGAIREFLDKKINEIAKGVK